jgi:hypothetical protein
MDNATDREKADSREKALELEIKSLREKFQKIEERYRMAFEYTGTAIFPAFPALFQRVAGLDSVFPI